MRNSTPLNAVTAAVAVHGARAFTTAGPMLGMARGNGAWGNTVHQHLACFAACCGMGRDADGNFVDLDPAVMLVRVQALIAQAQVYVGRWAHVYQPSAGQAHMSCTICNLPLYVACDHCLDGEAMLSGTCPKCGREEGDLS